MTQQMAKEEPQRNWQTVGITANGGRWQTALLSDAGCSFQSADSLWELCSAYQDADAVLIDLPVGLPESVEDEKLRPEYVLRKQFQIHAAAVPCRQAVYAADEQLAREENIRVLGRTLSPQQLAMRQQLRELDELLAAHNEWKNVLRQSHPQLLGAGRRLILQQYGSQLPQGNEKRCCEDALCLAVIGQMECRGNSVTLPETAGADARGIGMQVVAPRQAR